MMLMKMVVMKLRVIIYKTLMKGTVRAAVRPLGDQRMKQTVNFSVDCWRDLVCFFGSHPMEGIN